MNTRTPLFSSAPTPAAAPPVRLQRKCACDGAGRDCDECRKKGTLHRKTTARHEPEAVPPIVHEVLHSPGHPLDPATRAFMEPRFGHDFGDVRVHTDARAADSARAVDAAAYTVRRDVVFAAGQFQPRTNEGRRLLAHELAHAVQQTRFSSLAREAKPDASTDLSEPEAARVADQVLNGSAVTISQEGKGIQFYGHDPSCKDDEHLKPFIWPGHDHGKKAVARAVSELGKSPLHSTVQAELTRLFGKDGIANAKTIERNFGRIQSALADDYLYHCAKPCKDPNKGARAWTDRSGNKDITLCFDKVANFRVPEAAWIIIHENVHRGLNVWPTPHPWDPKDFGDCLGTGGGLPTSDTSLLLTNPDSYACFASRMWFPL